MPLSNIIIFRDHLLPPSETFINSQAVALKKYAPLFVGSKRVNGLLLDNERVVVINSQNTLRERLREKLFRLVLRPPASLLQRLRRFSPVLVHAHFALDAVFALP